MQEQFKLQAEATIPTELGVFHVIAFSDDPEDYAPHLAIISEMSANSDIQNVRLHSECLTGDILGSKRCDCGEQLAIAMAYIAKHGGMILYLRQEGRGIGLINKLKAYNLQDKGLDTAQANVHLGFEPDERSYELAVKMLSILGINKIRLLTNNPEKMDAFKSSDIHVIERIPIEVIPNEVNAAYLRTKREFFGHIFGKKA
jgi:GTP cyclohydrolase II